MIGQDGLPQKIAWALCEDRSVPTKELFESFEFWSRVRRRLRVETLIDVCSGAGLTGMVFGAMERQVREVILIDQVEPKSHRRLLTTLATVCPWLPEKVRFVEQPVQQVALSELPSAGVGVVGVHACGVRTDMTLRMAVALNAPVAVMPCCYHRTKRNAPPPLVSHLGAELATDIERTYWLRARAYEVDWTAIPRAVTPKNRILIAQPPADAEKIG